MNDFDYKLKTVKRLAGQSKFPCDFMQFLIAAGFCRYRQRCSRRRARQKGGIQVRLRAQLDDGHLIRRHGPTGSTSLSANPSWAPLARSIEGQIAARPDS
jgi:hypothetical protein